jgi:serine phosphatase RsbU (regulator of sigma subunit)
VTNVFDGLEAGQIIAIATDGIFEARDRHGDMFGHSASERYHPSLLHRIGPADRGPFSKR